MKQTKYNILLALTVLCMLVSCEIDESTDGTGKSVKLTRDLVLQYTFDEGTNSNTVQTVTDHSNKHINGVIDGSPEFVTDRPGSTGYALKLRAADFVNIPTYAMPDSVNVTVNMWLKDFGQGWIFEGIYGDNYISTPAFKITEADNLEYYYSNSSSVTFSTSMQGLQASGWHMITIAAARSQETISLYVDGTLTDTQKGYQSECSGTKMQIGRKADPMLVDNVRIYARCLNAKEVKEIYNEERK